MALGDRPLLVDPAAFGSLCACGNPHPTVDVRRYAGDDAFAVLADDCRGVVTGGRVLLVDDENTHAAAGAAVVEALKDRGIDPVVATLPGDVEMTDGTADRLMAGRGEIGLIIAVGAGTINDLGKYAANAHGLDYWAVPTAPSMNGYTSSIAAVKIRGVKRTLPARPPRAVYAHPRVVREAPLRLRQSGFCDILAKSVSDTDWQTESMLFSGSYCPLPSAVATGSESAYLPFPEKIRDGDEDAVTGLFDGLLLSGVAMTLAGSSAPASGGEHLVSHVLDMREGLTGRKPELHGLQVAAGVILSAVCYRKLAELDASMVGKGGAEVRLESELEGIPGVWGPCADEVRERFLQKRAQLMQFDVLLPQQWDRLQPLFAAVRKPEFFLDLIRRTGFSMTLDAIRLSPEEFKTAALIARTIRERITVLDAAAHAGVLEGAVEEAAALMG